MNCSQMFMNLKCSAVVAQTVQSWLCRATDRCLKWLEATSKLPIWKTKKKQKRENESRKGVQLHNIVNLTEDGLEQCNKAKS